MTSASHAEGPEFDSRSSHAKEKEVEIAQESKKKSKDKGV